MNYLSHLAEVVLELTWNNPCEGFEPSQGFQSENHFVNSISLKTNRYVGVISDTGAPYSANCPGTTLNRKDGTVLTWKVVEGE